MTENQRSQALADDIASNLETLLEGAFRLAVNGRREPWYTAGGPEMEIELKGYVRINSALHEISWGIYCPYHPGEPE